MRHRSLELAAICLTAFGLAGCQEDGREPGECRAEDHSGLIGQNISAVSLPEDLTHRIIAPDTAVTKDYNPSRLNVLVDADNIVTEVTCG